MRTLIIALFTTAILFSSAAKASSGDVAIVDIKRIVNESLATKDVREKIMKRRDQLQEEVNKIEEKLKKEDEDLASQRNILSKEAFEEKAREFQKRVAEAQRDAMQKRTSLENAYTKALTEVQESVVSIVENLAQQKGFSVAIPKSEVLFFNNSLDISDSVLQELNKKLPSVNVEMENKG